MTQHHVPWWETEGSNVVVAALPPGAEPAECEGCRSVLREDELFDGLCETCYAEYDEVKVTAQLEELEDMWRQDQNLWF